MVKHLVLISGAMGVGKSAVRRELLRPLTPGVWLDGDWCWNMNPFVVSEENKRMVLSNIAHLLRAYLDDSGYRYVVFCWVLDQPALFDAVLNPLRDLPSSCTAFRSPARKTHCGNGWNATCGTASGIPASSREASGACPPTPHCRRARWT